MFLVLCFIAGFAVFTQQRVSDASSAADRAGRLSATYQDVRFWVGQQESLERQYRLEPGPAVLGLHREAQQKVSADLAQLVAIDSSPDSRAFVGQLTALQSSHAQATRDLIRAVDANDQALVLHIERNADDPVHAALEGGVAGQAATAAQAAVTASAHLRAQETAATRAIAIAFVAGLLLLLLFGFINVRFRRRLDAARAARGQQLTQIATTDPLTGIRNQRAFQDDLETGLQRVGSTGSPLSLVMLDLDGLKGINDTLGHQAGDEQLQAFSRALCATERGAGCAYRVGGDEFAVILDDVSAPRARDLVREIFATLEGDPDGAKLSASAGISEAGASTHKDTLIREADVALIWAKRVHQDVAIHAPSIDLSSNSGAALGYDEHRKRTLANALARAVDAKDSYIRSHCQTVSQLCGLLATEFGFDEDHIERIRLAGLLHDVGKIGIADAILKKPARLTVDEYGQIQSHARLGYDIVCAAELPLEALWIRHHHERYDGAGYPLGLSGEAIPLESRILFVADAFQSMTSDRPYRKAPGQGFAIEALRRHSGTQFDPEVVNALCRVLDRGRVSEVPYVVAA